MHIPPARTRSIVYGIGGICVGALYSIVSTRPSEWPKQDDTIINRKEYRDIQADTFLYHQMEKLLGLLRPIDEVAGLKIMVLVNKLARLYRKPAFTIQDRSAVILLQRQFHLAMRRVSVQLSSGRMDVSPRTVIEIEKVIKAVYGQIQSYISSIHIATRECNITSVYNLKV
jgi:hypothetical protein